MCGFFDRLLKYPRIHFLLVRVVPDSALAGVAPRLFRDRVQ